ncbi:hypothetical protein [Paenibacillus sp. MMS20-IR301]|uniref:hypothetical protein n=1 Tax=Paenibacillus sp. MMS20-IR301 TaxID=2895946 RepID=UPI0028ED8E0B|nr:hypothetical protein [Paenibacillus sp. MMS20-IR301]WNS43344.1 hypothetical protein LOS79_31145 [Paenibacillus sp. MMS20-IR301]
MPASRAAACRPGQLPHADQASCHMPTRPAAACRPAELSHADQPSTPGGGFAPADYSLMRRQV